MVFLAASAGGFGALSTVLGSLEASFPARIVVVQHLDRRHRSLMAQILGRRTPLVVTEAAQNDKIAAGHVFIAPPNHHLLLNRDGTIPSRRPVMR